MVHLLCPSRDCVAQQALMMTNQHLSLVHWVLIHFIWPKTLWCVMWCFRWWDLSMTLGTHHFKLRQSGQGRMTLSTFTVCTFFYITLKLKAFCLVILIAHAQNWLTATKFLRSHQRRGRDVRKWGKLVIRFLGIGMTHSSRQLLYKYLFALLCGVFIN